VLPDCGGARAWKCNCSVKHALMRGGGIPYSDLPRHYYKGRPGPYFTTANDLADTSLNAESLKVGDGSVGDIVAWVSSSGSGHTGVVGCDGKIYSATRDGIQQWNENAFFSYNQMVRYELTGRKKVYRTCCRGADTQ
jgi:hypothetical protein